MSHDEQQVKRLYSGVYLKYNYVHLQIFGGPENGPWESPTIQ